MTKPLPADCLLPRARLQCAAHVAAKRLLGCVIVHHTPMGLLAGRIVETEAYDAKDPASHSFRGESLRTQPMFGPAGHLYVYRSYGIHLCLNITCGPVGMGAAVLIRALEPLHGLDVMRTLRCRPNANSTTKKTSATARPLCRGPGNLTQALAIALEQTGRDALDPQGPVQVLTGVRVPAARRVATPRIGITKATQTLWRFYEADSPYVSLGKIPKP